MFGPALVFAACSSPGNVEPDVFSPEVVVAPPGVAERIDSVPVYGGTLEPVPALDALVAADPEGNRLLVIAGDDTTEIDLGDNARPFRLHVEGTDVWVTLRGTGELVRVDLTTDTITWRAHVCTEPRGVARSQTAALVVACADGPLVEVADDGHIVRAVLVDSDLRDVVPVQNLLFVSRFATAEVILLDPFTLGIESRITVGDLGRVGWRMRAYDDDGVLLLHQVVLPLPVTLDDEPDTGAEAPDNIGAGPYGCGVPSPCGRLHGSAITRVTIPQSEGPGVHVSTGASLDDTLVTDFVMGPTGEVAVAATGAPEGSADASLHAGMTDLLDGVSLCDVGIGVPIDPSAGRATAVAYDAEGRLVVQTAAPSGLLRFENGETHAVGTNVWSPDDEAVTDFHTATQAGVACASCHPEGTDDANVWVFQHISDGRDVGPPQLRRTMPLAGQLLSRAPYHWDAGLADPDALMLDTLTHRMGGGAVSPRQVDTLFTWLDGLRPVRGNAGRTPDVVDRGRVAFAEAGCAECHAGPAFTDNAVHTVRRVFTDEDVKTPSLLGVGNHTRLFHDGCAETLENRFEMPCDDQFDTHGRISTLSAADIDALTAYLRTL